MRPIHELVRLARRIHAVYEHRAAQAIKEKHADWKHLSERFQHARQQRGLIEKAQLRGWYLAASKLHEPMPALLGAVSHAARDAREKSLALVPEIPRIGDLVAELQTLEAEFHEVIIDNKKPLTVHTEPMVLEGVDLGRFSVQLQWRHLAHGSNLDCIEIVPLDPNPASGNDDVPHPHVRGHQLCAGDADEALRRALEQGRLADAFLLIRSVLETYNPHRAYASLKDWGGVSCWNCGYIILEDDNCVCESCEHDTCSECISSCKTCDRMRCRSCQTQCDACDEPCCLGCLRMSACSEVSCCADCLRVCSGCGGEVVPSELDETAALCPTCLRKQSTVQVTVPETNTSNLVPSA